MVRKFLPPCAASLPRAWFTKLSGSVRGADQTEVFSTVFLRCSQYCMFKRCTTSGINGGGDYSSGSVVSRGISVRAASGVSGSGGQSGRNAAVVEEFQIGGLLKLGITSPKWVRKWYFT